MHFDVTNFPLFAGMSQADIKSLLGCLQAKEKTYKKGDVIFKEGRQITQIGLVLSGMVLMQSCDMWGNNTILGNAAAGSVFAEAYAIEKKNPLPIFVVAAEDSHILFIEMTHILTPCCRHCAHHSELIKNLLTISVRKNMQLSRRILYTGAKTIRGRLLAYLSDVAKKERSMTFELPYNRQQLADFLNVDRSAMCSELSKMQKDGLICYKGRRFTIEKTL